VGAGIIASQSLENVSVTGSGVGRCWRFLVGLIVGGDVMRGFVVCGIVVVDGIWLQFWVWSFGVVCEVMVLVVLSLPSD